MYILYFYLFIDLTWAHIFFVILVIDDDFFQSKAKGVEGLIQVENPNRVQKKVKKLATLNEVVKESGKPELSRRER